MIVQNCIAYSACGYLFLIGGLFAMSLVLSTVTQAKGGDSNNSRLVIEWAEFELIKGVSEETLIKASEEVQNTFLKNQTGFVKRELLKGTNNKWVDLVYWDSMEDAERAVKNVANSPACHAYFRLMVSVDPDHAEEAIEHYQLWKAYE